jgi:hypothetical protein
MALTSAEDVALRIFYQDLIRFRQPELPRVRPVNGEEKEVLKKQWSKFFSMYYDRTRLVRCTEIKLDSKTDNCKYVRIYVRNGEDVSTEFFFYILLEEVDTVWYFYGLEWQQDGQTFHLR